MRRSIAMTWSWIPWRRAPSTAKPRRFEPPPGTVQEQWVAYHAFNRDDFELLLSDPKLDPFRTWNSELSYAYQIEADLHAALALRLTGHDMAARFLSRALAVASRMRSDGAAPDRLGNKEILRLERGEAYARWLMGGGLERGTIERACRAALKDAGVRAYDDDDGDPRDAGAANAFVRDDALLAAARMALVGLDADQAVAALKPCKGRGSEIHRAMKDALLLVAETSMTTPSDGRNAAEAALSALARRFQGPKPEIGAHDIHGYPTLVAFELFAIRQRYFGRSGDRFDTSKILGAWLTDARP
jgi:hypothetical protein